MPCCGSKRRQAVASAMHSSGTAVASVPNPGVSHVLAGTGVEFIYDGAAGVIVTGHATGRRYRFGERGARLVVDARDARFLDATPKLRRVSP